MEQTIIDNDLMKDKEELDVLDNNKDNLEIIGIENTNDDFIENIEDNFQGFTPIASDSIQGEILDLDADLENYNNEQLLSNENNDIIVESNVNSVKNADSIDIQEQNEIENDVIKEKYIENTTSDNIESFQYEQLKKPEVIEDNRSIKIENEQDNVLISNDTLNIDQENVVNNKNSLLEKYGENLSIKKYVCNPAIGRDNEIKQLILTLLTPEKSGILVGKPGIGKTAIVEGLGYQIQNGNVPDALKEYQIHKLNTSSLLGFMPGTEEAKIQVLLNEIKDKQKLILFIDEIHTLIGTGAEGNGSLDFANIFKPGLDRGNIKIIGATTSDEYDRYILTDKAFVRRFQKIEVLEPTKEHTVKILMGSLPKLEYKTGVKIKYTSFIQEKIMNFIVDLTTEYRRVYELSARYPDVALTILQQAFSYAVFDNKKEVGIRDVRKAIKNTKLVYPDVIKKELIRFNDVFSDIYLMETPQRLKGELSI